MAETPGHLLTLEVHCEQIKVDTNPPTGRILQIPASFHGFQHGYFVGILQISAYGNPNSDAGHPDAERLQKLRKVNCRRLALRRWIRCNNNLFDRAAL